MAGSNAEQKKLRQAEDGKKAMQEYEAEAAATRAKTERLRALRMEREAAAPRAAASPKKTAAQTTKVKPKPLSEWISDQKKDGMPD
jgi:hypothetical protein